MVQTGQPIKKVVDKGDLRHQKQDGHQKQMDTKFHSPQEAWARYSKSAKKWGKAIRKAQWNHSEEMFKGNNQNNIHKAKKASDEPRSKEGLPDMKGISSFQGKCDILWDTFFPANVTTPPPIPPNWLATPKKDKDDRYIQVMIIEILAAIRTSRTDSAVAIET